MNIENLCLDLMEIREVLIFLKLELTSTVSVRKRSILNIVIHTKDRLSNNKKQY